MRSTWTALCCTSACGVVDKFYKDTIIVADNMTHFVPLGIVSMAITNEVAECMSHNDG